MLSGCHCEGIRTIFGERTARRDLRRYRRKGPLPTTRILLDALQRQGIRGSSLLDIGGGVGAIPNELLRAGVESVTAVDAAPAYLAAAEQEAERRGNRDRIAYRCGDFVALAPEIPPADIVTLDRVICCYPEMQALVAASAERAKHLYGVVYPRDRWWDRIGVRLLNLTFRICRNPFRVYVHPTEAVDRVIRSRGLTLCFRDTTPFWQVLVYERARALDPNGDLR